MVFTGLRAGEKLYEELLADTDQTLARGRPRLRIARLQAQEKSAWLAALCDWLGVPIVEADAAEVRSRLAAFVPEHSEASPVSV